MGPDAGAAPEGYHDLVRRAEADERELVSVERHDGWALVRLDDAHSLNPLSGPLTVQLLRSLEVVSGDPAVGAVVLTGADPAFSAGGDLRAMASEVHPMVDGSDEGATAMWRWIRRQFGGVVRLITRSDKIFVAAVNGPAAGVGLAFAMACDLVLASERARILTAFGRIGLVPEVGLGWLLSRRVGHHRAMELFLDGTVLTASRALELGLVNEVVVHEELLPRAGEWCEKVRALPPHAVELTKPLLRSVADMTWEQAITMEEFAEPMCFTTRAHRDAVAELLGSDA